MIAHAGGAESRTKARQLIESGCVYVNGKPVLKASAEIGKDDRVELKNSSSASYVGRGGLKLEAALREFMISPASLVALDIGASTGGFTECLLKYGAEKVFAVDSGSGQLHPSLMDDMRVVSLEGINARYLTREDLAGEKAGIVTMDVSFISQSLLYGAVSSVMEESAALISLIKPQFEVGRANVGKGGLVRDKALHAQAIENLVRSAAAFGLFCTKLMRSPIDGGDGNKEYLAAFYKKGTVIDSAYVKKVLK